MRKLIKSKERVRDYGEVYTPHHIISEMLDMLEKEDSAIFTPRKTFLEPACGDGNFLVAILERKLKHCTSDTEIKIAVESLYGIDILADNVQEARKRMQELLPFDCTDILERNIVCGDFLKLETVWFLNSMQEREDKHDENV